MTQIASLVWLLLSLLYRVLRFLLWPIRRLYSRLPPRYRSWLESPWRLLLLRFQGLGLDEKWGYFVWGVMGVVVAIPEIAAAVGGSHFPWRTISGTIGHLEDLNSIVAIAPVAVIAMLAVSVLRFPKEERVISVATPKMSGSPDEQLPPAIIAFSRSRYGRLMHNPVDMSDGTVDESQRHVWDPNPYFTAVGAAIIVSGWLASRSGDPWVTGYVIYSEIAFFWMIVPNILSLAKRDIPFRTLFFTLRSLEYRLRAVVYVVGGGLAILFVHLALYPWPDLARLHSEYAGESPGHAQLKAEEAVANLRKGKASLVVIAKERAVYGGAEAWRIYFGDSSGNPTGCVVRLTEGTGPKAGSEIVTPSALCATSPAE